MRREDFLPFQQALFSNCANITKVKGSDYAGDLNADHFANFTRAADTVGLTPLQVWSVFVLKHWDAIMAYVRDGKVESEPIEERIKDVINYLTLLAGHVSDVNEQGKGYQ